MVPLLVGALAILGTHVVLGAAFVGIGLAARRALGPRVHGLDDVFRAFWVGLGIVIGFLLLWNAALPVNELPLWITLAAGLLGLVVARDGLRRGLRAEPWRPGRGLVVASIIAAAWVAHLASGPATSWDDSLYHMQAVQWAQSYPVVPGIANLLGPLGFNNASFLYAAMVDSGPWRGGGFHVAGGLLVLATILQGLVGAARLARGAKRITDVFSMLLLAPGIYWALDGRVASYSTDLPAALVLLAASGAIISWLGDRTVDEGEDRCAVISIAVLLSTVVCLKISLGLVSAFAMPMVCWFAWRRRRGAAHSARTLALSLAVVAVFALAWVGRGVVQSGYPLFPLTVLPFDVDWRAPQEHGLAEVANIGYTEREFAWSLGRSWLRQVLVGDPYAVLVPALLAALGLLGLGLGLRRRGRAGLPVEAWILLPIGPAVAAWITSAPSTRYGAGLLWALAAAAVSLAAVGLEWLEDERSRRRLIAAGLVLGLSLPVVHPLLRAWREGTGPLESVLDANLVPAPEEGWFHGLVEEARWTVFTTESGLELTVPEQAPAGSPGALLRSRLWDAPLPCTMNPAPNLRLRIPGELASGFRVEGEWAMRDFPNPWRLEFMEDWHARRAASP